MIMDAKFKFADQQALTGTSDVNSANVYDAGAAKKAFEGSAGANPLKIAIEVTASGGTTPTIRARFVGADDAGLTSNVVILADTGVSPVIVAATDLPVKYELVPSGQTAAKRYYGVIWVQSGTNPTATVNASGVIDSQTAGLR